ncbi:MAG: hypothetical protein JXL84_17915 [Deltaproteobacteria bacterium]|nr:hypothetical protein [Deltaproteobacteria bacterium]
MDELLTLLNEPDYPVRYAMAKTTGRCIKCGGRATAFTDASARIEYAVSALCECCQREIFN